MQNSLRVKIFPINIKLIEKSGIGRAIKHQNRALELNGIHVSKDNYFDIAHINTYTLNALSFIDECKDRNKKIIIHAHSTEEDFRNSFMFSNELAPLFKKWLIYIYNKADLILTPTPYSKQIIKSYGVKPEIIDISNGIDTTKFVYEKSKGDDFRAKYGFNSDDKIVMSVGLQIRRKGIFDFVELAKSMPEYHFVWCGYTNPTIIPNDTRELLQTNLPNLHFVGFVDDMVSAYSAADLFFMPSYEETEGIVVLEALAMKRPTLLRDIDVYKPWLKDGENCYMRSNNDEFKEVINEVLSNGASSEIIENAYKVAMDRDIEKIGSRLKEIYTSLVRK